MRILLMAYGSRGDIQPMLALGRGLKSAGYATAVAGGTNFRRAVEDVGLDFEPFTIDVEEAVNSELGRAWLAGSSDSPRRELYNMRRMVADGTPYLVADLLRMVRTADVFISGLMTLAPMDALIRAHGKHHIAAWLAPMLPTRRGASGVQAPFPRRNTRLNRWFGYVVEAMLWTVFAHPTNYTRDLLGLPPATRSEFMRIMNQTPSICGFSPLVVPPPDDWPSHHHITGYWHAPTSASAWTPPASLCEFLAGGDPPVYIGFGSMASHDPAGTVQMIIDAVQIAGKRGILQRGWAKLHARELPETIHLVDDAPHDWLLPQMAAVIHHGGAGTTAAALRAGVPSLIVAHMGDQSYWGRRVYELGVGASPLRRHQLTTNRLVAGILQLEDAQMRQRAAALAHELATEDGVATAVDVLVNRIMPRFNY